jgi:hypothetical protein
LICWLPDRGSYGLTIMTSSYPRLEFMVGSGLA